MAGTIGDEMLSKPGPLCAGSPTINQFAKFLARFEEGDSLRWHFDSGSGSGIAPDAPASLARLEVAESADFNLIPGSQSPHDTVKYDADEGVGFLPRHPNGSANLFAQIYPGHLVHPRRITKKSITALPGARAVARTAAARSPRGWQALRASPALPAGPSQRPPPVVLAATVGNATIGVSLPAFVQETCIPEGRRPHARFARDVFIGKHTPNQHRTTHGSSFQSSRHPPTSLRPLRRRAARFPARQSRGCAGVIASGCPKSRGSHSIGTYRRNRHSGSSWQCGQAPILDDAGISPCKCRRQSGPAARQEELSCLLEFSRRVYALPDEKRNRVDRELSFVALTLVLCREGPHWLEGNVSGAGAANET
jgi:hypothetical protein